MTVTFGFYDSLNGDRKYNASQMSRIFDGVFTNGIFQSIGAGFVVTPQSGMTLNVGSGRAWFNYTWTYNDATITVTVDPSEAVLNRIDTVVIEVNSDIAVRTNSIKMVKGTPASSPVAPTLANTSTLKQYGLADIYVAAGVTSINAGNITNRIGSAGTPFITGILQSFDVATLFGQYDSHFNTWFTNLQNQLTTNQASNLQNQIDVLTAQNTGWILVSDAWTYNNASTVNAPSNASLKYQKGWGIRFKQGGAFKYFYITAVGTTTISVYGGTDYTVANAAITEIGYAPNPDNAFGFPTYFNYTPLWTADGNNPVLNDGTLTGVFSTNGRKYTASAALAIGPNTNIGSSTYRISIPYTNLKNIMGSCLLLDISAGTYYEGITQAAANAPNVICVVGSTIVQHNSPMTFANGDNLWVSVEGWF